VPVAANPVVFLDPDPDPGAPTARDFTTSEASAPAGTFRVVMFDAAGNRYEFEPQLVAAASPAVPNVSEVAAHLMAYTVDRGGRRLGNFTEDTQIRGTEVERIIPLAVSRVMSKIGALPAPLVMPDGAVIDATDDFRAAAALYAAIVAANGAIPEQSSGADSAVPVLERLLTGALRDLRARSTGSTTAASCPTHRRRRHRAPDGRPRRLLPPRCRRIQHPFSRTMALTHDAVWKYVKHLFDDYGVVVALKWWQDDDPVLRRRLAEQGHRVPRPARAGGALRPQPGRDAGRGVRRHAQRPHGHPGSMSRGLGLHIELAGDVQLSRRFLTIQDNVRDLRPAMRQVLDYWRSEEREQFDSLGGHASGGWLTLAPATIARKRASSDATTRGNATRQLHATETLRKSLTVEGAEYSIGEVDEDGVTFGTSVPYAGIHQTGGAHIPQRRPLEFTEEARAHSMRILQRAIFAA
jgi:phage gpG-like protein